MNEEYKIIVIFFSVLFSIILFYRISQIIFFNYARKEASLILKAFLKKDLHTIPKEIEKEVSIEKLQEMLWDNVSELETHLNSDVMKFKESELVQEIVWISFRLKTLANLQK